MARWPRAIVAQLSPADATLMFTSASPGEEKTATVARLAAALAQREPGGVLAIDGNLRVPELAARLGVPSTAGLADASPARPRGTTWSGRPSCAG